MTEAVYWIWLQQALGVGSIKADVVIRELDSPKTLYEMSSQELLQLGWFARKEIEQIKATPLKVAHEQVTLAEKHGCAIITPDHPDYPENLTNMKCMPCVLYVRGSLARMQEELTITMVGTRKLDDYGATAAKQLSYDLASAGCTIVSGLAVGVDSICHTGALEAGGRTIGAMACGMDINYPADSAALKRRILEHGGAIFSEFSFGTPAYPINFRIRNRLMSGIASGVLVVQAPIKSGAMITAYDAAEQNRELFAVPGEIFDQRMAGCNKLIEEGATPAVNVAKVLEQFRYKLPAKFDYQTMLRRASGVAEKARPDGRPRQAARAGVYRIQQDQPVLMVAQDAPAVRLSGLSEQAKRVYALLGAQPVEGDWLCEQSGMQAMECMSALTELELFELVRVLPGKRYQRPDR